MNHPFYLFYSEKFRQNYLKIKNTFEAFHKNTSIAYSFKTNSSKEALKFATTLKIIAEVVSPFEYKIAKNLDFEKIIYNGVIKDEETIFDCLKNNGKLNIDNEEDLKIVLDFSEKEKFIPKIGIRLNFDIKNGIKSRFGVDVESELFEKIIDLDKKGKIIVIGLHCHFTQAKELETWKNRAEQMQKYAKFFLNLEYLDFGGNMYSMSEKDFIKDYASILSLCVKNVEKALDKEIELIIEAGTPLISDCFDLISNVKHIKNGFIFLDCSKFDLGIHAQNDKTKIFIEKNPLINEEKRIKITNAKIVGYTCMENDVLKKSFSGKISIGDRIVFKNVGNYSVCWANDFICEKLKIIVK